MPQNLAGTPSLLSANLVSQHQGSIKISKDTSHESSSSKSLVFGQLSKSKLVSINAALQWQLPLTSDQQASEVTGQAPTCLLAASEVSKALSPKVTVDGNWLHD